MACLFQLPGVVNEQIIRIYIAGGKSNIPALARAETNLMKHLSNFDAFLQKFYRRMDVKTRNGVVQTLIAAFLWGGIGNISTIFVSTPGNKS